MYSRAIDAVTDKTVFVDIEKFIIVLGCCRG